MEFFEIAITILAAILTFQTWRNGRWMKQSSKEMQQAHKDTQDLIREIHKDTPEILKEISKLIVSKGEKTRQVIKATS